MLVDLIVYSVALGLSSGIFWYLVYYFGHRIRLKKGYNSSARPILILPAWGVSALVGILFGLEAIDKLQAMGVFCAFCLWIALLLTRPNPMPE